MKPLYCISVVECVTLTTEPEGHVPRSSLGWAVSAAGLG